MIASALRSRAASSLTARETNCEFPIVYFWGCTSLFIYVGISDQQFHRRRAALPLSPFQPRERAQKDLRLALSFFVLGCGAGALRLLPVALLYFRRPLAVRPAPRLTGNFSPRPTDIFTPRFLRFDLHKICASTSMLASLRKVRYILRRMSHVYLYSKGAARAFQTSLVNFMCH